MDTLPRGVGLDPRLLYNVTAPRFGAELPRDLLLFYEYFHGDNGAGMGASHQTGWTALVAKLLLNFCNLPKLCKVRFGQGQP